MYMLRRILRQYRLWVVRVELEEAQTVMEILALLEQIESAVAVEAVENIRGGLLLGLGQLEPVIQGELVVGVLSPQRLAVI